MKHTVRFKVKEMVGAMTYKTDKSARQLKDTMPRFLANRLRSMGFTIGESDIEILSVESGYCEDVSEQVEVKPVKKVKKVRKRKKK